MDSRWPGFRPGWASLQSNFGRMANCDLPRWIKRREADVKYMNLVGGLEHGFYFSIYWECHHPNWRSHIFQTGRAQPPTSEVHDCMKPESCDDGFANYHFLKRWWSYFRTVLNSLPLQIQPALYLSNRKGVQPNGGKVSQLKPVNYFPFVQKWCSRSVYIYICIYTYTYTDSAP